MKILRAIGLALSAALIALPVAAATGPITEAAFDAAWSSASCGDTLTLSGAFAPRTVGGKRCEAKPITLDARKAVLTEWSLRGVSGLKVVGGEWHNRLNNVGWTIALSVQGGAQQDGTPADDCAAISVTGARFVGPFSAQSGQPYQAGDGKGMSVLRCRDVAVSDTVFTGFSSALLFGISSRISVENVECALNSSDCVDLGQVWGAKVQRLFCHSTITTPGVHPDCVQAFSRYFYPNSQTVAPPSSDLVIDDSICIGVMQCVFLGNHVRTYADGQVHDDGGFDRAEIARNVIAMSGGNAIGLYGVRGAVMRDNRVMSLPSAAFLAGINVKATTDLARCGNLVAAFGSRAAATEAACPAN